MSAQTRAPLHAAHRRVDRDQHQQPARHRRRRATYRGPSSNPRARRHRPSAHPARNRSEQRESMAAELCLARYVLLRSFTSLFLHPICTPFFFQTIVVSTLLIHSSFSYTKSPRELVVYDWHISQNCRGLEKLILHKHLPFYCREV